MENESVIDENNSSDNTSAETSSDVSSDTSAGFSDASEGAETEEKASVSTYTIDGIKEESSSAFASSDEFSDTVTEPEEQEEASSEVVSGEYAILEETSDYLPSDLINLLEFQHAENVAYLQNVQTLLFVSVVLFGVLFGCVVVDTVAGFFHDL